MLIFGPRPNDDSYGAANPSLCFRLTIARHNKRVAVLYGPAGAGKTTMVQSYLQKYSSTFTSIFWIDATNQASIKESYAAILQKVQPSKIAGNDVVAEVLNLLTEIENNWAVVFDGAPGTDIDARFVQMARSHQGMIFITTRNAFGQFTDKFEVGPVEEVQAIQELLAYVNSMDEESARLIVRELEGYGLALKSNGLSVAFNLSRYFYYGAIATVCDHYIWLVVLFS